MISATRQFDWDSIKRRLQDGSAALNRASVANETRLEEVYRQRQLQYAQRSTHGTANGKTRQVLVFLLGKERYAIDLPAVVRVFPLLQCTPVPGSCKEIVGVINVSGEIRSVVDAGELLGLSSDVDRGEGQVILLRENNLEVALRVDRVEAIETIALGSLAHAEDTDEVSTMRYVEGMAPDSLIVLNTRQLMSHPVFQSNPIENKGTEHDHR
jgi:purine-binding chemotaxis protein CheW